MMQSIGGGGLAGSSRLGVGCQLLVHFHPHLLFPFQLFLDLFPVPLFIVEITANRYLFAVRLEWPVKR